MAVRRILRIDDPADLKTLKARSRPVRLPNPALRALAADMFETMHAADGVGLAAPQIGLLQRLVVITIPAEIEILVDGSEQIVVPAQDYVLANPEIVKLGAERET